MARGADFESLLQAIGDCLRQKGKDDLTPLCRNLLEVLWHNRHLSYPQIVEELRNRQILVGKGHLRNEGALLWKALSSVTDVSINKKNVVEEMSLWFSRWQLQGSLHLQGRHDEIAQLMRQMQSAQYRVICITGPPLIGKTELVNAATWLLRRSEPASAGVMLHWFDAEDFETVEHCLTRLCSARARSSEGIEPVVVVLEKLRQRPLLLVVNDADSLYDPQQPAGTLKPGNGYERLLRQMINDPTIQGRLVWVSRVNPHCLEQARSTLLNHQLPPLLLPQAVALLTKHFPSLSNPKEQQQLVELCGAIPGLLLAVSRKIQESFGGSVSKFMANPLQISNSEDEQWRQAIADCTENERVLVVWLLLQPLSFEGVMSLTIPGMTEPQRRQAMQSLYKRGFIKLDGEDLYSLYPPYLRYILADWLVHHISQHLLRQEVGAFLQYPLILPLASAWQRQWQHQHVLRPLARAIQQTDSYWQRSMQQTLLSELLEQMRKPLTADSQLSLSSPSILYDHGYAVGTVLNLATALKIPLAGLNISGLTIRCADLDSADLRNTDAKGCQFEETAFPISFAGTLVAEMSADGQIVVVGDEQGRIGYWVRSGKGFKLCRYHRFGSLSEQSARVKAIALCRGDTVAMAVGASVYRWRIDNSRQQLPQHRIDVDGEIRCLAQSDHYIAVGLENGRILIDDLLSSRQEVGLGSHTGPISVLALNLQSSSLASVGLGNRVLTWDLLEMLQNSPQAEIPSGGRIVLAVREHAEGLLLAGIHAFGEEEYLSLRQGSNAWVNLPAVRGSVKVTFSQNGEYLAAVSGNGVLHVWTRHLVEVQRVNLLGVLPNTIAISDDGKSLLTLYIDSALSHSSNRATSHVQLWDVQTSLLIWELQTSAQIQLQGLQLHGLSGISDIHLHHLDEFIARP